MWGYEERRIKKSPLGVPIAIGIGVKYGVN